MSKLMDNLAQQAALQVTHSYAHTLSADAYLYATTGFLFNFSIVFDTLPSPITNISISAYFRLIFGLENTVVDWHIIELRALLEIWF